MLDDVDQINWDELSHAYGKATDVPDLLRALASDEKEIWDDALSQFYGNIWHQGTVYEATAYAVPFLIELLEAPDVACKADILALLHALASGSSYLDVHQDLDSYHNERRTAEFRADVQRELDWVHAAHVAVVEGMPVYLRLLSDADTNIRGMASYVLSACVERLAEIEPALDVRIAIEGDVQVKAGAIMALARLWHWTNQREPRAPARTVRHQSYFESIFRSEAEAPVVRFVAALSAADLGGQTAFQAAVPVLRQYVDVCRSDFGQLPWIQGDSPLAAVSAVLTPDPHARLQWLVEMLGHRDPEVRKDAIWDIAEMCRQRRSAPQLVVPHLVKLLADPESEVRQRASQALPDLGHARHLATETLESLRRHSDPEVRMLAAETLQKVRANRGMRFLEHCFRMPDTKRPVTEWIAILQERESSRNWDHENDCAEAATALEVMGSAARDAVPALRAALTHNNHWVRVRAARALWRIAQDSEVVLPVLLEELQCRPAGLLVTDCLGEMGHRAERAIPALRRVIDSEVRLVKVGDDQSWVDADEAFCEAAQRALERIEADITDKE